MKRILFQGDSITDAGRDREDDRILGYGYATMVAGQLSLKYPGKFEFINRGILGNRSTDLYARIKKDIINLKPDYVSMLLGANDVWHEQAFQDGVSPEKYADIYERIICETMQALPNTRIVILEPFVLHGSATAPYYDAFSEGIYKCAAISRQLAQKHSLPFVQLQEKISLLASKISAASVLQDGVHPTVAGHALIAQELCHLYEELISE